MEKQIAKIKSLGIGFSENGPPMLQLVYEDEEGFNFFFKLLYQINNGTQKVGGIKIIFCLSENSADVIIKYNKPDDIGAMSIISIKDVDLKAAKKFLHDFQTNQFHMYILTARIEGKDIECPMILKNKVYVNDKGKEYTITSGLVNKENE